jgi:hypothetical protein
MVSIKNTVNALIFKSVEFASMATTCCVSDDNRYFAMYNLLRRGTKILYPAYRLINPQISFDSALRDVFAHSLTTMNSIRRLSLPIVYDNMETVEKNIGFTLVFCTAHIRGVPFALVQLLDRPGYEVLLISASEQRHGWDWGASRRTSVIPAYNNTLIRLSKILERRVAIIALVDYDYDTESRTGYVSPNLFSFADKYGAKVIFFTSVLRENGMIEISFGDGDLEKETDLPLAFTRWMHSRLGWKYSVRRRTAGAGRPPAAPLE